MRLIFLAFLAIGCKKTIEPDPITTPNCTVGFADRDGDGFGGQLQTTDCQEPVVQNSDDCDDGFIDVNPDGREVCDERDNNCDGLIDLDDPTITGAEQWPDTDGDGFGAGVSVMLCEDILDYTRDDSDCDDTNGLISPDAPEICDGIDNDCDGAVDDDDDNLDSTSAPSFFEDVDDDGFGDAIVSACTQPAGTSLDDGDCDDQDPLVFPGADELCNNMDSDCDGGIDGDGFNPDTCVDFEGEFNGEYRVTLTQGAVSRQCTGTFSVTMVRTDSPPISGFFTCTFASQTGGFMLTQTGSIEGNVDIDGVASGTLEAMAGTSRAWSGNLIDGFVVSSSGLQIDPTTSEAWQLSLTTVPTN